MKEREAKRVKYSSDAEEILNNLKAECSEYRFSFEYYKKVIEQLKTCVSDDPRWPIYFQFVTEFLQNEDLSQKEFLDCYFAIKSELAFHRAKLESFKQWVFLHQLLVLEEQLGLVLGVHAKYATNDSDIYFRLDDELLEVILKDASVTAFIFKLFGINQIAIATQADGMKSAEWHSLLELIRLSRPSGVRLQFFELSAERTLSLTNAFLMCGLRKLEMSGIDFKREEERMLYLTILKELIPSICELVIRNCALDMLYYDFWPELSDLFNNNTIQCFRLIGSSFTIHDSTIGGGVDYILKKMKTLQLLELSGNAIDESSRQRIANAIKLLPINHLILRVNNRWIPQILNKESLLSFVKNSQVFTLLLKGYEDLTDEDKQKFQAMLRENHVKYSMKQSLKFGLLSYLSNNPNLLFSKQAPVLSQDLQEEVTELSNCIDTYFKC